MRDKIQIKRLVNWVWMYFLWGAGLLRFASWAISRRRALVVLTLHRVLPDTAWKGTSSLPSMAVRRSTFDSFLAYLSPRFEVCDLNNMQSFEDSRRRRLRVALTFDDGWADNYQVVHPIALEHSIPITIFICSGKMGSRAPFWPERVVNLLRRAANFNGAGDSAMTQLLRGLDPALEAKSKDDSRLLSESIVELLKGFPTERRNDFIQRLNTIAERRLEESNNEFLNETMSWSDAVNLSSKGVAFGSHTQNHEILTRMPLIDAKQELFTSKQQIEEKLEHPCRMFAYPNGDYNAEIRDTVKEAGYDLAFTTQPGCWTKDCDPYRIPRINIWEGKLTGRNGKFSAVVFQYSVLWKAFLASRN